MNTTKLRHTAVKFAAFAAVLAVGGALTGSIGYAQEAEPSQPAPSSEQTESSPSPSPSPEQEPPGEEEAPAPSDTAQPEPATAEPESNTAEPESSTADADSEETVEPAHHTDVLDDIEVWAGLDKDAYNSGDKVTVSLSISNTGDETVRNLTDHSSGDLDIREWGRLSRLRDGIDLSPHHVFNATFSGYMYDVEDGQFTFEIGVATEPDETGLFDTKTAKLTAPVTMTTGTYAGHVYADENDNGKHDSGEALPGVSIKLTGGVPEKTHRERTASDGRFSFTDIPTGPYHVEFDAPDGWYIAFQQGSIQVTEGENPAGVFRAVRPLTERLKVSMKFGKSSYQLDDTVDLNVTLTNTGTSKLHNITARCNRVGNSNQLNSFENGWGPLGVDARGAQLAPGETKTYRVTNDMPSGAKQYGYIVAACDFVSEDMGIHEGPGDSTSANIAGILGTAEGKFVHPSDDPDRIGDEAIVGVRYQVVDRQTGKIVAKGKSAENGDFDVTGIPANLYELKLVSGWRFEFNDKPSVSISVDRKSLGRAYYALVGGPGAAPGGEKPNENSSGPAGGGSPEGGADELALTGFQVAQFSFIGLLTLGAGVAALAYARRRKAATSDNA